MSNFTFLKAEWPELHESALKVEAFATPDPRTSCFYARLTLELAVRWLYKHDAALKLPYQENLSALIHEPTFKQLVGNAVFAKARVIKEVGNLAVHSQKPIRQFDALSVTRDLFHFCFWLARTYARKDKPADSLQFDSQLLGDKYKGQAVELPSALAAIDMALLRSFSRWFIVPMHARSVRGWTQGAEWTVGSPGWWSQPKRRRRSSRVCGTAHSIALRIFCVSSSQIFPALQIMRACLSNV